MLSHVSHFYSSPLGRLHFQVGSQSLVVRANDNGLTALHTSVTVTVRVIRQSNLPPEIVRGNATLSYYRGNGGGSMFAAPSQNPITSADLVIARVTVKDRTAHDRLTFELLPDSPSAGLFRVDPYDGTVRSASSVRTPVASTDRDPNSRLSALAPLAPKVPPLSRLDSGIYPLRIRVTNGSLASEETLYIRVSGFTLFDAFTQTWCLQLNPLLQIYNCPSEPDNIYIGLKRL